MVVFFSIHPHVTQNSRLSDLPQLSRRQRKLPPAASGPTQPNTDSTDLPRALWCDPLDDTTKPSQSDCPQKDHSKMTSFCAPFIHEHKDMSFANPDIYTSAGLVANAYPRFRTTFWLDRALIWLTVVIPVVKSVFIVLLHAFLGVARCVPKATKSESRDYYFNNFVDRACGLQLTTDVLKGYSKDGRTLLMNGVGTVQLQHECYPFILLMVAVIMWIPHYLYYREVDRTARRDLCLVRSELHSFRRAVGRELNYLQAVTATSLDGVATMAPLFSPGSTMPPAPVIRSSTLRYPPGQVVIPQAYGQPEHNSGLTTAATLGGNSSPSQTPAPTAVQGQQPRSGTMGTVRCGLHGGGEAMAAEPSPSGPPLGCGDADFSAPGLLDLPCFHACHADWSLNTYLSAWQNTDFYWRRYLTKHAVLACFQIINAVCIFTLIGLSKGAPFAALFICDLEQHGYSGPLACMLQTTFILNMSIFCWGFLTIAGLCLQFIYFYSNFVHSFWRRRSRGHYLGVTSRPTTFITGVDETHRCFFADYIRLLAYTAFRDTQCEIRSLSVSYASGLYRSDFHFISLMCTENAHLIPDAIHIHFWTERYARLSRRRFRRPYWAIRRGSLGHLVRCEDLSMKFNFSKIKVKVEVNDFGF
ncbi:unnamed protein product [Calicophoron daubneyi]|uniref:Autophagy-related protein 9 n=1 Tax=Calicophoron daubneyi TaxID=300641 RepID=A0AAV2T5H6_CALDB